MRLLQCNNVGEFSLTRDLISNDTIPPEAILSHPWVENQEVMFKDPIDGTGKSKSGYEQASILRRNKPNAMDDLQYFWLDTCCIEQVKPCRAFTRDQCHISAVPLGVTISKAGARSVRKHCTVLRWPCHTRLRLHASPLAC